jgi:hypothetical protein
VQFTARAYTGTERIRLRLGGMMQSQVHASAGASQV